jgi:hypothetical protein
MWKPEIRSSAREMLPIWLLSLPASAGLPTVTSCVNNDSNNSRIQQVSNTDTQHLNFSATNCDFSFLFDDTDYENYSYGGAIRLYAYLWNHSYELTVTSCTFDSCWAVDGGAVYVKGSAATVSFSRGTNCTATNAGAFLYLMMINSTDSCTVNSTSALQCRGARATISFFAEPVTPSYVADSLNLTSNFASGIASGIRIHPHLALWLHFSRFQGNAQGNVLSLFANHNLEMVECLWVVNNTCGNNSLIVVNGSYWIRLGIFLMNDADYLVGFGESPTAALTLWKCVVDSVINWTAGGLDRLVTAGINISAGHSVPLNCPFTIGSPVFSNSLGFHSSMTIAPSAVHDFSSTFTQNFSRTNLVSDGATPLKYLWLIILAAMVALVLVFIVIFSLLRRKPTSTYVSGEESVHERPTTLDSTACAPDIWFENPDAPLQAGLMSDHSVSEISASSS